MKNITLGEALPNGIYRGIPAADYFAMEALNNSYLKRLDKCPAAGKVVDEETTKAQHFGRAAHTLVLEGEEIFKQEHIVIPDGAPKRPTEKQINAKKPSAETLYAVDWWHDFSLCSAGKQPVATKDHDSLQGIRDSVFDHDFARSILVTGVSEQTAIFDLPVNGEMIRCKCRPDRTPHANTRALIDLKTCEDASYRGFRAACHKWGYFHQAAFYIDGYNASRNKQMIKVNGVWQLNRDIEELPEIDAFIFIAVEKKKPFRCEVYTLCGDNKFLISGREQYMNNLLIEMECRKKNRWPAFKNAGADELLSFEDRGE